jgi:hypothetical protein
MRGLLALAAVFALGFGGATFADDGPAAGSFLVVTGDVKVLRADGSARAAQRGGEFRQGESIVTGPDSLAQLRMTDGAAISVRAGSHLRLDQYRFRGSDDPEPSFLASLVKGGFRTITGWVGRIRRENYRVATTSATLGIRGTHFEVVHVEQPLPDAAPGTYNRVYEGITTFRNRAGTEILVSREQTAFVALPGNLAPVLVTPPVGIFGKPTPVPTLKPQASGDTDDKAGAPRAREAPRAAPKASEAASKAGAAVQSTPLRAPVESLKTTVSPALVAPATSIAPQTSTPLLNPLETPATISPTLTAPATTISPTLTAPTTTISPTLTAPTTTISPTLTAPTTTISPTLTAPTTTISPTLTAPTTTISPTLTTPTTTISPTITVPATTVAPTVTVPSTTISPTLTAPVTNTINTIKR